MKKLPIFISFCFLLMLIGCDPVPNEGREQFDKAASKMNSGELTIIKQMAQAYFSYRETYPIRKAIIATRKNAPAESEIPFEEFANTIVLIENGSYNSSDGFASRYPLWYNKILSIAAKNFFVSKSDEDEIQKFLELTNKEEE